MDHEKVASIVSGMAQLTDQATELRTLVISLDRKDDRALIERAKTELTFTIESMQVIRDQLQAEITA